MIRIALPLADGSLAPHYGHCQEFAFIDVERNSKALIHIKYFKPPGLAPDSLPKWLAQHKTDVVITGGLGPRTRRSLINSQIEYVVGAPTLSPETIVQRYLDGELKHENSPLQ